MDEMDILTFEELRDVNVKRCEDVFFPLDSWTPSDWACALAGEAGEACNAVKKLNRGDGNVEEVGKELADTIIYADLLAARLGIDLAAAVVEKFNEVSEKRGSNVRLPLDVCPLSEEEEDELIRRAQGTVRAVLKGERVGYNNGLHWAAKWIEDSGAMNGNSAVIEFAKNMAMSIRAHRRNATTAPTADAQE
jgi:NTP pyrophosphatase (non-canonical NTP hydrolase)